MNERRDYATHLEVKILNFLLTLKIPNNHTFFSNDALPEFRRRKTQVINAGTNDNLINLIVAFHSPQFNNSIRSAAADNGSVTGKSHRVHATCVAGGGETFYQGPINHIQVPHLHTAVPNRRHEPWRLRRRNETHA